MITIKIKEIMEQKNLSVNKVSRETGISRPALTSLYNNESKGIQFDTLEKLMDYFNVPVSEILGVTNEEILFVYKSTIGLNQIKQSEQAPIVKSKKKNVVYKKPSEMLAFNAEIIDNGKKSEPFSFAIAPMITQGKILVITIGIYRADEEGNPSDLWDINRFLGNLDTEDVIKMSESLVYTWAKFYNKFANVNDLLSELLMIEIALVSIETRIPVVANVVLNKKNDFTLNFDLFRKNSPITQKSNTTKNIIFRSLD